MDERREEGRRVKEVAEEGKEENLWMRRKGKRWREEKCLRRRRTMENEDGEEKEEEERGRK